MNRTMRRALRVAARKSGASFSDRKAVWVALAFPRMREELEFTLTQAAVEANAIPAEGTQVADGVYVGDWMDLLDWLTENWDEILEMVMTIIALFV